MTNIIVVGLGYGDEGKGATVDFLCSQMSVRCVVKCNGGHQCAHNVHAGGISHCFSQIGSGALSGVQTILDGDFIVEFSSMRNEMEALRLKGGCTDVRIAPHLPVTTPYETSVNRIESFLRSGAVATCGKGIGETRRSYNLGIGLKVEHFAGNRCMLDIGRLRILRSHCEQRVIELLDSVDSSRKDEALARWGWRDDNIFKTSESLYSSFQACHKLGARITGNIPAGQLVFEGSQGYWLDQVAGNYPHVTWGDTTSRNAIELAGHDFVTLGVTRSYSTRHGADPNFRATYGMSQKHEDNASGGWQGIWSVGRLDRDKLSQACIRNRVDGIVINHLDDVAMPYDILCDLPVVIRSNGPMRDDRTIVNKNFFRDVAWKQSTLV